MLTDDRNLVQLLTASLRIAPRATAFRCLGRRLRCAALDALSDDFAHWLLHYCHLQVGERVAVQLPNLLQYPVVALGILKARGVIVNINPLYTPVEVRAQLADSGARVLVVFANTAASAAGIIDATAVETVVVTHLGDLHGWPQRLVLNAVARHRGGTPPRFPREIGLREALAHGRKRRGAVLPQAAPDDLAVLQYTGGTTGIAKGAMLTHRNLASNMLQLDAMLGTECPGQGAVMVAPLPLYHIYAFTMNFLLGLYKRHDTVLIPNPRDIDAFVGTLRRLRINGIVGITTLYRLLCEHPRFHRVDFSALRIASSGGMALSRQVAQAWESHTGCRILEGYGLSECSPVVACGSYRDYCFGSVGSALPGTEVCLKTPEGTPAAPGEAGELCVRGPQVMQGYWQRPEENAHVFDADGWLHTGDVATRDEAGRFCIIDRIKDLIIVSGFNVFPNEIEEHACTHPDISDACAIAVGDDCAVQIKLFVVRCSPALTPQEVITHCRQALAGYKVPRLVEFRESLPKSNVGKVLRRQLREEQMAQALEESAVAAAP